MLVNGSAELPLHYGRVPQELLYHMKRLGKAIALYIIDVFGPEELVKRLSDPVWFQAFNNVIGMDWDSSGSTTIVLYVLKDFANVTTFHDVGLAVLGGKGRDSRRVIDELAILDRIDRMGSIDLDKISYTSILSAKIDGVALQDGYSLYVHSIILSQNGLWTVVQQGMNTDAKVARRYHIHNMITVERDPHSGIACNSIGKAVNLIDYSSESTRNTIVDIINSTPLNALVRSIADINRILKNNRSLECWISRGSIMQNLDSNTIRNANLSKNPMLYRPIIDTNRVERALAILTSIKPSDFEELLVVKGVGAETLRALTLVADIIYGEKPSFKDPVTHTLDPFVYSFAHGGKDGIPYPVKLDVMKETIEFLEEALEEARVDIKIKRKALERLSKLFNKMLAKRASH